MGGLMPKPPAMPSAEEQFETQRRLQEEAESRAVEKAEKERREAMVEEQRRKRARRGRASLISQRPGSDILGIQDEQGFGPTQGSLFTQK